MSDVVYNILSGLGAMIWWGFVLSMILIIATHVLENWVSVLIICITVGIAYLIGAFIL